MRKRLTFGLCLTILFCLLTLQPRNAQARRGFSVGLQGMGNFFLTHSTPDLNIGPGGGLFFDYRFNQRWAIETDLFATVHNGRNISAGDNNILLLGVPSVELKFYMRPNENRIDPYLLAGLGVYVLTEGSINNNAPRIVLVNLVVSFIMSS